MGYPNKIDIQSNIYNNINKSIMRKHQKTKHILWKYKSNISIPKLN